MPAAAAWPTRPSSTRPTRATSFSSSETPSPPGAAEAERLLGGRDAAAADAVDREQDGTHEVTRYLWLTHELASFGDGTHLRTVVRVRRIVTDDGGRTVSDGERWFLSNVPYGRFKPDGWLTLVRRRWAVENECHNTWDRILREDDHPWVHQPQGMLVTMLLRRLASNALALYRCVTQRSDDKRRVAWRELINNLRLALLTATEELLVNLRPRRAAATEV
jgi:hypothetical protein